MMSFLSLKGLDTYYTKVKSQNNGKNNNIFFFELKLITFSQFELV